MTSKPATNKFLVLIALLLLGLMFLTAFSLITPDYKRRRYSYELKSWWQRNKPKVQKEYLTVPTTCTRQVYNGEAVDDYFKQAKIECISLSQGENLSKIVYVPGRNDCLDEKMEAAPPQYLTENYQCTTQKAGDNWFWLAGKKIVRVGR